MADNQINKEVIISVKTDVSAATGNIDDLKARLNSINNIDLGTSTASLKEQLKQAAFEVQKMKGAFGENSKEFALATDYLIKLKGAAQDSIGTLKSNLKEANNQAQLMLQLFGENSAEFRRAAQEVAQLQDKFSEYNDTVKAFNPDNKLQGLVSIAKGATGAVQGVSGAMAFLGVESDKASETMAKLQGLMAFSDALSSVDDIKNSFKNFGSVLGLTTTATEGTSLATKGLGLALKSLGIGLIVAAISYLVSNWDELKKSFTSAFPVLSKLGDYFNIVKEVVVGVGSAVINYAIAPIKALIKVIHGDFKGAIDEVKHGMDIVGNYQKSAAAEASKVRLQEARDMAKSRVEESEARIKHLKEQGKDTYALELANNQIKKGLYDRDTKEYKEVLSDRETLTNEHNKKLADAAKQAADKAEQERKARDAKAKAERDKIKADLDASEKTLQTHLTNLEKLQTDSAKKIAEANVSARQKELVENASKYDEEIKRLGQEKNEALKALQQKHNDELKLADKKDVLSINKKFEEEKQKILAESTAIQNALEEAKGQNDLAINEKYSKLIGDFIDAETKTAFDKQRATINKQYDDLIDKVKDKQDDVDKLVALRDSKLAQVDNEEKATKSSHTAEVKLITTETETRVLDTDTPEQRKEKVNALNDAQLEAENAAFELKKVQLMGQHDELETLEAQHGQKVSDMLAANRKANSDLDKQAFDQKMQAYKSIGDAAGALGNLFGKQTVANKALNSANALMNTYVGISEIWRAKSLLPEPLGTIQKVASTVIAAASGFSAVKSILATKVPGGDGGGGSTPSAPSTATAPVINSTLLNTPTTQDVRVTNQQDQVIKAYISDRDLTTNEEKKRFLNNLGTV